MKNPNDIDLDLVKQKVHELMVALNATAARANWGVKNDKEMVVGLSPVFLRKTSIQLLKKVLSDDEVSVDTKLRALDLVRSSYEHIPEFKGDAVSRGSLIHDNLTAQVVRFYDWHLQQQIELDAEVKTLFTPSSAPRLKV